MPTIIKPDTLNFNSDANALKDFGLGTQVGYNKGEENVREIWKNLRP